VQVNRQAVVGIVLRFALDDPLNPAMLDNHRKRHFTAGSGRFLYEIFAENPAPIIFLRQSGARDRT
jgi:hypothetical protein